MLIGLFPTARKATANSWGRFPPELMLVEMQANLPSGVTMTEGSEADEMLSGIGIGGSL
jgi:hypothetical protein